MCRGSDESDEDQPVASESDHDSPSPDPSVSASASVVPSVGEGVQDLLQGAIREPIRPILNAPYDLTYMGGVGSETSSILKLKGELSLPDMHACASCSSMRTALHGSQAFLTM